MFEQNIKKKTSLGILRELDNLQIDQNASIEEKNRKDLINQIKKGNFRKSDGIKR